jgi:hypothetical protein
MIDPNVRRIAAREYARWNLGSSAWADNILDAYDDPIVALQRLAAAQGGDDSVAAQILDQIREQA